MQSSATHHRPTGKRPLAASLRPQRAAWASGWLGVGLAGLLLAAAPPTRSEPGPASPCRRVAAVEFCRQRLPPATTQLTCYERHGLGPQVPALDLSPLRCLPQLQSLSLASGEIEFIERLKLGDLSPLGGLPLQRLALEETQLAELTPLARLTQLEVLSLHASPVQDLGPLAGLFKLRELDLSCTQVRDLSPLRRLAQLRRLDLTRTPVADLRIVAELPELSWLGLSADAPIPAEEREALRRRRPTLILAEGRRY